MLAEFAFSDFANWGKDHNRGFVACIEACKNKTCALDIGAHIGLVTMPMSTAMGPEGKVVAFEPSLANRQALTQHLSFNNLTNVVVIDSLIGDKIEEKVTFYESAGISGMNTCAPVKSSKDYKKSRHYQTTIDEFCKLNGLMPNIIKIDVEGWELSVLEGATQVLRTAKPMIFLSVHPKHIQSLGRSTSELQTLLGEVDYEISDVSGHMVKHFELDEYILAPRDK